MTPDPKEILEKAKKAKETAEGLKDTKKALEGVKGKVDLFTDVIDKTKDYIKDFKHMTLKERADRAKGILFLGIIGYAFGDMTDEEKEWMQEGVTGTDELNEDEVNAAVIEAQVAEEEYEIEEEVFEMDEDEKREIPQRQTFTNMYAMRFYNKDGSLYARPSKIFKGEKPCRPSKFILRGSAALFDRGKVGLNNFDSFVNI